LIQPRYLNVEAAAIYLGTTPGALYKAVQRRLVPHRKNGKRLVFDRLALDAWINQLEGVDVAEAVGRQRNAGTMQQAGGAKEVSR